ncbi:hypothetical protein DMC30DRAFT_82189 [Rhodotorula diobovata]|uniref:Uncharacterized protein n=1 Tax=Rhodotorula diobovata TaxID=5288 RepID=A0A5C5FNX5_9BASI|nr:hypothetical protein DMC30DRAFT_82189 [Rhodotorula diobovata]
MQPPSHFAPPPHPPSTAPPPFSAPLAACDRPDPLAVAALDQPYPPRPRLKRAHASADTHTRTSIANPANADPDGPAAPAAVVQPAPAQQQAWSAHLRQRSTGSNLDPIKESAAEADPWAAAAALASDEPSYAGGGGLGLDFGGVDGARTTARHGAREDDGDEPPRRKRIRLAPDHEAFGRLSLAVPSPTSGPGSPPAFHPVHAPSPHSSAPAVAPSLRPTVQPLPSSGAGAFSASSSSAPLHFPPPSAPFPLHQRTPSSPLAGHAPSLPAAPPTSPVSAAAGAAAARGAGIATGGLPTVPWSQSAFFGRAGAEGDAAQDHEVTMLPASGSVDLSPHRVYVASLSPSPSPPSSPHVRDELPSLETGRRPSASPLPTINPLAVRAAALEGLPPTLVASLRREAEKAQRGELVLYRPPPSLQALSSRGEGEGEGESEARRRRDESWREFERAREREEARHDARGEEDDYIGGGVGVGAGEGGMDEDEPVGMEDVEMEL